MGRASVPQEIDWSLHLSSSLSTSLGQPVNPVPRSATAKPAPSSAHASLSSGVGVTVGDLSGDGVSPDYPSLSLSMVRGLQRVFRQFAPPGGALWGREEYNLFQEAVGDVDEKISEDATFVATFAAAGIGA